MRHSRVPKSMDLHSWLVHSTTWFLKMILAPINTSLKFWLGKMFFWKLAESVLQIIFHSMKGLDSASYHYPSYYFEGTIMNLVLEYFLSCLKGASTYLFAAWYRNTSIRGGISVILVLNCAPATLLSLNLTCQIQSKPWPWILILL